MTWLYAPITETIASSTKPLLYQRLISSALLITVFEFFFGVGNEQILVALVVLVSIDFITGVLAAHKTGKVIESRRAFKTAVKLFVYALFVAAGYLTAKTIPHESLGLLLGDSIVAFLAITELISIIENVGALGYATPKKLLNQLHELQDNK